MYINNPKPIISVILPVYNGGKYLKQAIDSILQQTIKDFELFIIDDASTDGSLSVIKGIRDDRIRIVTNEKNLGERFALEKVVYDIRGEFCAIQHQDDFSLPERLEVQMNYMKANPDVVIVGSNVSVINQTGALVDNSTLTFAESDLGIRFMFHFQSPFHPTSVMVRADVYKKLLLEPIMGDFNIWYWIMAKGKGRNIQKSLATVRKHITQFSSLNRTQVDESMIHFCQKRIEELGISLSHDEMARIRKWNFSRPITLGEIDNLDTYNKFYLIFVKFIDKFGINVITSSSDAASVRKLIDQIIRFIVTENWFQVYFGHQKIKELISLSLDADYLRRYSKSFDGVLSELAYKQMVETGQFDDNYYLNTYPDINIAINSGKTKSAWEHYLQVGFMEARQATQQRGIQPLTAKQLRGVALPTPVEILKILLDANDIATAIELNKTYLSEDLVNLIRQNEKAANQQGECDLAESLGYLADYILQLIR